MREIRAGLATEDDRGRVLDRDRIAKIHAREGTRLCWHAPIEDRREFGVVRDVGRHVALEDDRRRRQARRELLGEVLHLHEILLAFLFGQPHDLERAVAFDHAGCVVVDRFAGTIEQTSGVVVLGHDEVRVGLGTLQRDADRHLADGAARQRVRAAHGLRAEDDVDAERSALAHESIEQQRCFLRDLVVLDEELLELIHDQESAGHERRALAQARAARPLAIGREVLHARIAEEVAALGEFRIEATQHRQTKLTLALDRDDACVWHLVRRVRLELDALLEVHEIELDLFGAIPEREVRHDRVQQRGLTRTSAARDQDVL
jgi:hypothetical protein